ncbi:type II toxin-antitoxin system VapC family toxin [Candidatus Palauibacter sp.]|uniref:type II toxin-antitoxin system VapC family toxin n=1 Tax=Candidatus Palauibacter sp. TaxID=3101350 RepID=UPI003AF2A4D6
MITAADTSVLLDVFLRDDRHGHTSRQWLREAYDAGALIICDVVYAELAPAFPDRHALDRTLREINVVVSAVDSHMAYDAGQRWGRYRQAGGTRARIISDFLIGAHAVAAAERFLTRDRGFYSSYFPELDRREIQPP